MSRLRQMVFASIKKILNEINIWEKWESLVETLRYSLLIALRKKCLRRSFFWSVFSPITPYISFSLNKGNYGPETSRYLDTFHVVSSFKRLWWKYVVNTLFNTFRRTFQKRNSGNFGVTNAKVLKMIIQILQLKYLE